MLPVVFSKLNGRIWQLKACYEILCVGKTSRTWKQMKHLMGLGKERGFLELSVSNVWGYSIILSTTVHSQVVISCQENILIFFRLFSALGSIFSQVHGKALRLSKVLALKQQQQVVLYLVWSLLTICCGPLLWKTCGDCVYKLLHLFFFFFCIQLLGNHRLKVSLKLVPGPQLQNWRTVARCRIRKLVKETSLKIRV